MVTVASKQRDPAAAATAPGREVADMGVTLNSTTSNGTLAQQPHCLKAALWYARHGLLVIPTHSWNGTACTCKAHAECSQPAKHPLTPNGSHDQSCHEPTIRAWFHKWSYANVAIVTGQVSRIMVLDVDNGKGGGDSLVEFVQANDTLPDTWTVTTGGLGEHLYYKIPDGVAIPNSVSKLGTGLDVRGEGGFVLAPPSLHKSGRRYTWDLQYGPTDLAMAMAPDWLIKLAQDAGKKTTTARAGDTTPNTGSALDLLLQPIHEHERNDSLTRLAGFFRRLNVTEPQLLVILMGINAVNVQPPLSDREIATIVSSVCRYPAEYQSRTLQARAVEVLEW